ncbi:MAG: hypothetical protein JNL92_22845 [Opitutaceae bacterium]|nr:hypothetical protein [Opitutaceae bacterium]
MSLVPPDLRLRARVYLALLLLAGGVSADLRAAPAAADGVLVYRTMLPDCGPSSFAVALGPNLGFSYDPGRGGVNYVWQGAFVDLGPTWKAKINQPAEMKGAIVYREHVRFPLRLKPGAGEPAYVFKGYVLLPDAVEFHYTLDGIPVREEIRAAPGGRGLVRHFRADTPVEGWSYAVEPQPTARIASPGGAWNEARTALTAPGSRAFSLQIDLSPRQP